MEKVFTYSIYSTVNETFILAPSPPQHPRTFVTYYSRDPFNPNNYQIKVSLYWLPPERPNGIVTSYIIYKTSDIEAPWEHNVWEPANNIYLSNQTRADPQRTYYFKVRNQLVLVFQIVVHSLSSSWKNEAM